MSYSPQLQTAIILRRLDRALHTLETPTESSQPVSTSIPALGAGSLDASLGALDAVTLNQLDAAQLHDRVESKTVLNIADIPAALAGLADEYFVMEHEGTRLQGYCNEYFDSPDLASYHEHHNGKGRRFKVRYRTYTNSDVTFFEVKQKANGRTVKERQSSMRPSGSLWASDALFFYEQTGMDPTVFVPALQVDYQRILLVRKDFSERVTIDIQLRFTTADGATQTPQLAVCEFKQPELDRRSPAISAMARRPQNFSKYCMGLASCDPALKRNRFKKVFRNLDHLGAPFSAAEPIDLDSPVITVGPETHLAI